MAGPRVRWRPTDFAVIAACPTRTTATIQPKPRSNSTDPATTSTLHRTRLSPSFLAPIQRPPHLSTSMRKLAVLLLLALILLGSAAASPTVISALDARGHGQLGGTGGNDGPDTKPGMWAARLAGKPSVAEAFKTTLAPSADRFADRRLSRRLMQGSGPASWQFSEPADYGGGVWKARVRAGVPVVRMNDKADARFAERKPWGATDQ